MKKKDHTWCEFEKEIKTKKIILFGVGKILNILFRKYPELQIDKVIDNSLKAQGFSLSDFIFETIGTPNENKLIESVDLLKKYTNEEALFVIGSKNYYTDIYNQLIQDGFSNIFILQKMIEEDLQGVEEISYSYEYFFHYPFQKNKIVVNMFNSYTDHGKYICEELLRKNNDVDIVFAVNDSSIETTRGMRVVRAGSDKYVYEMSTAHIWITNSIFPEKAIKKTGQICIETKHWASVTLKKFYLDASTIIKNNTRVKSWIKNGEMLDYIFTGSQFDTDSCRRGFGFSKEVIEVGSCRSDAMFQADFYKEKIYQYFHISKEKKLLVYAPTYRYQRDNEAYIQETREVDLNYEKLQEALKERFGGDWYIILRLHPGQENAVSRLNLPEYIINGTEYPDGQELCAACDILISDYSSIMFEPAFVYKPVFLFATDKDEYINKEYDLLIDYDTLPFPIAESNEELAQNILQFNKEEYDENLRIFFEKYGVHEDGHASERAADFIIKLLEKQA